MAIFALILSVCFDSSEMNVMIVSIFSTVIRYLPWVAHVCKIEFGSVPNLINYGHFFIHFVCLLIDFIHIWHTNQVSCVDDV